MYISHNTKPICAVLSSFLSFFPIRRLYAGQRGVSCLQIADWGTLHCVEYGLNSIHSALVRVCYYLWIINKFCFWIFTRQTQQMTMGCYTCIRYLMFAFNFLFWVRSFVWYYLPKLQFYKRVYSPALRVCFTGLISYAGPLGEELTHILQAFGETRSV